MELDMSPEAESLALGAEGEVYSEHWRSEMG